jgi:uncharacterized membrane protein HdeD (DUF308 family)
MIPNLINTAIGIWLVYAAVLNPTEIAGRVSVLVSGVVVLALAIWAYQDDYLKWPALTSGVLGAAFAVYAGLLPSDSSDFVTFWIALFFGSALAVVSLWNALYRQPSAAEYSSGGSQSNPVNPEGEGK